MLLKYNKATSNKQHPQALRILPYLLLNISVLLMASQATMTLNMSST